jgi:hypothetical protein
MGGVMYLMPQGRNLAPIVEQLEKRVEVLENLLKQVELTPKPKVGRPSKVKNESNLPESGSPSSD